MKVCIVGAGAIGGFIGTRLAQAGRAQVSAVARGETLQSLREHGWRLDTSALGPQDVVLVAVKSPALGQVAQSISPLLGPRTVIVPAMNGVPWWFCQNIANFPGGPLDSVDPGGVVSSALSSDRVLGCVVHASTSRIGPGVIRHSMGNGLIVGEAFGGPSDRARAVVDLLADAGFDATLSVDVRYDIWYKLWGNMTMNPVSAFTGATVDRILADPLVKEFCSSVMLEAADLGSLLGCAIKQSPEDRHVVTATLGAFKTSMLQDVEAQQAIELDALVSVVHEIGQRLGKPMPNTGALLGMTRLFARVHGLYDERVRRAP